MNSSAVTVTPGSTNPSYEFCRSALANSIASDDMCRVESILEPFQLTFDNYKDVKQRMYRELFKGLAKDTNPTSSLKMLPTHVRGVPDGTETGSYIALDLGGSNFRILGLHLQGGKKVETCSRLYRLTTEVMRGTGEQLFDYIADCIAQFTDDAGLTGQRLPLGFTFSFPCHHTGVDKAILTIWTKTFDASGVEGEDVGALLSEALKRRNIEVDLMAIINDTTGALVSCAYEHRDCKMGLIIGTGCNCCYIEKLENVELWNGDMDEPREVLIDAEWGAFGDNGILNDFRTPIDYEIDVPSVDRGRQLFEKMIAGHYLGDIARLILCQLAEHNLIFNGRPSESLKEWHKFETRFLSEIEGEPENEYKVCEGILREIGLNPTLEDCRLVRKVCQVVSTRAGRLIAAGISAVVDKMGVSEVTVGIDGSVYQKHPKFHDIMKDALDVLSPDKIVKLKMAHDGSGHGAALVAAVQKSLSQASNKK